MRLTFSLVVGLAACTLAACDAPLENTPPSAEAKAAQLAAKAAPVGRWLAGDTHVHNDHSSDGSALRQGLDGRGPGNVSVADQNGQGVLNNLDWLAHTDHRTYDQHYDPQWESADLLLIPGEETNGSPHGKTLGAVDWLVQAAVVEGRPEWSRLQSSIWDAQLQGAVYGINHPDDGMVEDDLVTPNERANAVGYAVVETWNKASDITSELRFAENRWNAGFRFGGVGASDNHFRELWSTAGPGLPATQVFARDLSERSVLQGAAAGRATLVNRLDGVTPTATLEADADGDGMFEALAGDEVVVPPGRTVALRVSITNALGNTINVWQAPGKFGGGPALLSFTGTGVAETRIVNLTSSAADTWVYVEVTGVGELDAVNTNLADNPAGVLQQIITGVAQQRRAITSPVFIGPRLAEPAPATPLPADIGTGDGASLALGEAGAFAGFPDLAVSGGVHHLVAEQHAPGRTRVVYRRIAADGTAGAGTDLAPTSASARFPRIAAQGQNLAVVWQDERAGQVPRRPAIYLRRSADGGASWAAEELVRGIAGRAERPAVAFTPQGQPVVVWQEIRSGEPFDVLAQVIGVDAAPLNVSRPGKRFNAANVLDTRSAFYPASVWPAVAVRADGLIAIAYQDNRNDQDPLWTGQIGTGDGTEVDWWEVHVHTRAANAMTFGAATVLAAEGEAFRHPALAFAGDGALVATWDGMAANPAGSSRSPRVAASTDGGSTFSTPRTLAADTRNPDGQHPRLGTDADGRVRAVWFDNRAADWRWRVMTSVRGPGDAWEPATMLMAKGLNGWPATASGAIVLTSTRNATRVQRDATQQVFLLPAGAASVPPGTVTPPATLPVIGAAPLPPGGGVTPGGRFGGGANGALLLAALALAALARQGVQVRFRRGFQHPR